MTRTNTILLVIFVLTIGSLLEIMFIKDTTQSRLKKHKEMILKQARAQADNVFVTKIWNTKSDGVYIKQRKSLVSTLQENQKEEYKYLSPVEMTKQIFAMTNERSKNYYKITSLNPLNPSNKADFFESKILKKFEKEEISEFYEFNKSMKKFNYMQALKVTSSCIECHAGYKVGDVRGGIRVTINSEDFKEFYDELLLKERYLILNTIILAIILALILIWLVNIIFNRHETIEKISKEQKVLSERYEHAINGSYDGLWDWNVLTNEVYFSKIWKGMLGYEEHELAHSLETWEALVHPDDFEQARQDIRANHEGRTAYYENVHRLKHKNGYWVWILDRGRTIFDENKKPIRMVGFHSDITAQKELEISLKQSERNLQKAEKMSNLGHWRMDLRNKQIAISDSLRDILGLDLKEELSINELLKELVHNDDKHRVLDKFLANTSKGRAYKIDYKIVRKNDKEIRYVDCNIEFIKNKEKHIIVAIGTIQDVTELALIQNEVSILRQAVEQAPISFEITDIEGSIQYVNPHFTEVTGYTYQEILGKDSNTLKSEYINEDEHKELWQTISSGNTWSGTFKNLTKDKKEIWEMSFISPIIDPQSGQIKNYLAIKQDITEEVNLKEELQTKEELMIAQSRHAAMGEMISMIAHQWRQPIAVVAMGANNILMDIELDMIENDSLKETAEDIVNQTQYLSQTIEDFRNFFKPNKEKEIVCIKDVFDDAIGVMGKTLENNNIELIQEYNSNAKVETFSRELLQVFINIIKNSKEILVEKEVADKKIAIKEYLKDDRIIIEISDNAGGIPEDIIDKIFEPYFTTKDELAGTGLGLYMSKTIVEKHLNGTIKAYNKDDGACFEIIFKVAKEV